MSVTVTTPPNTFNPQLLDALKITGQICTLNGTDQIFVLAVEGDTWSTCHMLDDSVTIDAHCTHLALHEDPTVFYRYTNCWGEDSRGWTRLSQVKRGVCLAKW